MYDNSYNNRIYQNKKSLNGINLLPLWMFLDAISMKVAKVIGNE